MEKEEKDRISSLPDCLILEILSRLVFTKEAIKTGTLSKRWQYLWTTVPILVFMPFDNRPLHEFFSLVENTLAQCRHLNLNKFLLCTRYDIQFEPQFNNWVQYAIRCNVQKLDLTLCGDEFVLNDYFFTATCFTHLTLSSCVFNLSPGGVITWNKLTYLCISIRKLSEDLIQTILSGSPLLETLKLCNCYGYKRLDITSKSVKNLFFSGYTNRESNADIIEINAPYILSLGIGFDLFLWKLSLLNVSSLVEAFLNYSKGGYYATTSKQEKEEMLNGFILKLRHIKKLTIGNYCARTLSRLEAKGLTLPPNLKVRDVTSPEYAHCSSEVRCESSDSESNVSGDWEEPLLDESSEVDELFETDSYENEDWEEEGSEVDEFDSDSDENGDTEEPLLDETSEVDELSDNNSVENGDWNGPLLDEGTEVDDLSHSDSVESRDDEDS